MSEFGISFSSSDLTSMLQERLAATKTNNSERVSSTQSSISTPNTDSGKGFLDVLQNAVQNVNEGLMAADKASRDFVAGKAENLHDVMIAMEKADVSLRTLTSIRGKVVEAYQEIMKMPI